MTLIVNTDSYKITHIHTYYTDDIKAESTNLNVNDKESERNKNAISSLH